MNEKPKNGRPQQQTERNKMIENMYHEEGLSYGAIAKKTGLSKSRVRQLANPWELPPHDRLNYLKRKAKKLAAAKLLEPQEEQVKVALVVEPVNELEACLWKQVYSGEEYDAVFDDKRKRARECGE